EALRRAEAAVDGGVRPVEAEVLQDLLGPRFDEGADDSVEAAPLIDVDQDDLEQVAVPLAFPLHQGELLDAHVSGHAPEVEDVRLAGERGVADLLAARRRQLERRGAPRGAGAPAPACSPAG